MTVMELTDSEVALVMSERRRLAELEALIAKRKNCKHEWSYRGAWRGESVYECSLCGSMD